MAWPYHILDLTDEQKHERRILLDRYGTYAQLSALVPILVFQLCRLARWVYAERRRAKDDYSAVPSSPSVKHQRSSATGSALRVCRKVTWWLEGDLGKGWGSRGGWFAGLTWTLWLLFLCVHNTRGDYLHVTKRFGVVAASQFPVHYMLMMKSKYAPLAFLFQSSHEQLNSWHRILGRIIYTLLIFHATWYMNFFVQANVLYKRLTAPVVIVGIVAFSMLTILSLTSLQFVRRWSYRVFFVIHLMIGLYLPILLFFHHKALRLYVIEAILLFIFDITCRKLDTITGLAQFTLVQHTKLIKIKIPIPAAKIQRFLSAPGQHVYLSIPPSSIPKDASSPIIFSFLYNPFTVAEVSSTEITLILRALHGPATKALETLAHLSKARPPINIEGPLGHSKHLTKLASQYDRILLVAGGVGGTYILPFYYYLREQLEVEARNLDRLKVVWSMRSAAEAGWLSTNEDLNLANDENIKVFITRSSSDLQKHDDRPIPVDGSVELNELDTKQEPIKVTGGRNRPELKDFVDKEFRASSEEKVAIIVCGPDGMAKELREHVGRWVSKGREVYFHDESFGW